MAEIKKWKCDICGSTFEQGETYFEQRNTVNIEIYLNNMLGDGIYKYKDACLNCRIKINDSISNKISQLENST